MPGPTPQSETLVFLPAWNEEESVARVISGVKHEIPEATLLVIDDGSSDGTVARAREAGASVATLPFHLGLGAALQTGYQYAEQEGLRYFAHLDSDGQHPPAQLKRILQPVWDGDADLVLGSRFADDIDGPASEFRSSPMRRLWIFVLGHMLKGSTGRRFTDITSGFRAGNRTSIELFAHLYQPDFGEIEGVQTALSEGLTVLEVPVTMIRRELGASYLTPLPSFLFMFKAVITVILGRFRGETR